MLTSIKIAGVDAIRLLNEHRGRYLATGKYPFLAGETDPLELFPEATGLNDQSAADILNSAGDFDLSEWILGRQKDAEEFGFSDDELLGEWPGEIDQKGEIGLHKDVLTGKVMPEVYLGLADIEHPWQLPAVLRFGNWNECPEPAAQCAIHRHWHEKYGAEIVSVSADVVECIVKRPPRDRESAIALAWEQYWYCADIVEQGCGSVSNLAATLLNSPYWYFWWD
jgi:hypothetical protein